MVKLKFSFKNVSDDMGFLRKTPENHSKIRMEKGGVQEKPLVFLSNSIKLHFSALLNAALTFYFNNGKLRGLT